MLPITHLYVAHYSTVAPAVQLDDSHIAARPPLPFIMRVGTTFHVLSSEIANVSGLILCGLGFNLIRVVFAVLRVLYCCRGLEYGFGMERAGEEQTKCIFRRLCKLVNHI